MIVKVKVRSWEMRLYHESPHRYRSARVCVKERMREGLGCTVLYRFEWVLAAILN